MGYGRPGTARVTGSRAIVSPRLVVAPSRGGHHRRPWTRSGTDQPEGRAAAGWLAGTGDSPRLSPPAHEGPDPTEAANLTAFICGLSTSDPRWSLKQVNQLLFLRAMRQAGRFGDTDGAKKRTH